MKQALPTFVLDTSVFVEAHRNYYTHCICPGFWQFLVHYARKGDLVSIDRVRTEVFAPEEPDVLQAWARQAPSEMFASSAEQSIVDTFSAMQVWAQRNVQFRPDAREEFARVADGWVTAYAKTYDAILVTQEVHSAEVKKRVPIPNVCREFSVTYVNTFEMLRQLGARFHWQQS